MDTFILAASLIVETLTCKRGYGRLVRAALTRMWRTLRHDLKPSLPTLGVSDGIWIQPTRSTSTPAPRRRASS